MTLLRAPFPWFGGKRRVADLVWAAFGRDVHNYIEPFAGSLAVLLARPGGPGKIETVNDRDRYLANFWRAVSADPMGLAKHCNWPVNEADLHARHKWLVGQEAFRERMHTDPDFYDLKIAGWWVWGICQWIGTGWCVLPSDTRGRRGCEADWRKRPQMDGTSAGQGIHSETPLSAKKRHRLPRASSEQANRPDLSTTRGRAGMGVHSLRTLLPLGGGAPCEEWFLLLQERLRRVRVACGDWKRVLGPSVLGMGNLEAGRKPCAVFLDPPYAFEVRDANLYAEDDATISGDVAAWAVEHGENPDLRIVLAGYEGEHEMPKTWTKVEWKGTRGYANDENQNRKKERLWLSPHCLREGSQQSLWGSPL